MLYLVEKVIYTNDENFTEIRHFQFVTDDYDYAQEYCNVHLNHEVIEVEFRKSKED